MNKINPLANWRDYRLSWLLFALWFSYIFVLTRWALWAHIGVSHMEPLFADLHAVLAAIDCHGRGINVFETNPCDIAGRIHVYGSLWLHLDVLGIASTHLFSKGFVVDIVFMAISVFLIKPKCLAEFTTSCLILFSSAVTLGIERANNDLIVFSVLACSAILLARQDKAAKLGGLLLIYLSALLKIYPSVLFGAALFTARRNIKELIFISALAMSLSAIWLITNFEELLMLKAIVPKPLDFYATGARAMLAYVGRPYPWVLTIPQEWLVAGFVSLIASCSMYLAFLLKSRDQQPDRPLVTYAIFIFGLTILFVTYTINSNYDYRWIFFIFTMPLLFDIQKEAPKKSFASRLVTVAFICAATTMWIEAFRASSVLGTFNINVFFNIGRSTFSIELLQQFLKELSAWGLFIVLFAFAVREFPKKAG